MFRRGIPRHVEDHIREELSHTRVTILSNKILVVDAKLTLVLAKSDYVSEHNLLDVSCSAIFTTHLHASTTTLLCNMHASHICGSTNPTRHCKIWILCSKRDAIPFKLYHVSLKHANIAQQ